MDTQTKKEIEPIHDILDNVDDTNIAKTKKAMQENERRAAKTGDTTT